MRLYFAPDTCSFAPHILMQELGPAYDLVRLDNRTKRALDGIDCLAINPKGYVAALQLDKGEILTEGPALVEYLADLKSEARLTPATGTLGCVRLQERLRSITAKFTPGSLRCSTRSCRKL